MKLRPLGLLAAADALIATLAAGTGAAATSGPTFGASATAPGQLRVLEPDAQTGARRSRAEVAQKLDPSAVKYYVETYGVTELVARERLVDQNLVVGLPTVLKRQVGDDLGSVAYDNSRGEWVVSATTSAARTMAESTLEELNLSEESSVIATSVNGRQLVAAKGRIERALEEEALSPDAATGIAEGVVTIDIDSSATAARKQKIRSVIEGTRETAPVRVAERGGSSQPAVSCAFPYCDTLVAGTQWVKASQTCTIAFYVSAPGGGGNPHMLTAGHCVNPNYATEEWFTCRPGGCLPYNTGLQGSRIYGGSDSGLLAVGTASNPWPNTWAIYPGYWNWSVGGLSTVRAYYPYNTSQYRNNNAPEGLIVCKNGRSTATTCGTITNNFLTNTYDPPDNTTLTEILLIENMCMVGGDSGSPVTAADSETAVGILSGGNAINNNTTCSSAPRSFAEPVGRAVAQLGVQIYGY